METKILVDLGSYNLMNDQRLLIPFLRNDKIGFMNNKGEIIIDAKFSTYEGECYCSNDLIKVGVDHIEGYTRPSNRVACYHWNLFGLINFMGKYIYEPQYREINVSKESGSVILRNEDLKYGVGDITGNVIVPFGKYDWMDNFENGLARVLNRKPSSNAKWGIINDKGEEVLPLEYDKIWKLNHYFETIIAEKGQQKLKIDFVRQNTCRNPRAVKRRQRD